MYHLWHLEHFYFRQKLAEKVNIENPLMKSALLKNWANHVMLFTMFNLSRRDGDSENLSDLTHYLLSSV